EPLDAESDVARTCIGTRLKERAHLTSDHQADDAVDRGLGDSAATDEAPVAKYGVAVAELHHFFQPMGDENDREPLRLEVADDAEELLDLGQRQRRGRLVHYD